MCTASESWKPKTDSTMEGWIKIHRKLLDWEWHDVPAMMTLWVHILMLANNDEDSWKGIEIRRGQIITSMPSLSKMTGLTIKQVRLCLKRLKDGREIVTKRAGKFTILTICKFDCYQLQKIHVGQEKGTEKDTNRAAKGQQRENIRRKEIKTSTKVDAKSPSFVEPAFEESFSAWLEYKHQRRESYKSDMSLKACYNKLVKLAGGDPATAKAIVEQSMANNWAGLFPLKNERPNGNKPQQQIGQSGQVPGGPQKKDPLVGYEKVIRTGT